MGDSKETEACKGCPGRFTYILKHLAQAEECKKSYSDEEIVEIRKISKENTLQNKAYNQKKIVIPQKEQKGAKVKKILLPRNMIPQKELKSTKQTSKCLWFIETKAMRKKFCPRSQSRY